MTTKELVQTESMVPAVPPPRITPDTIRETTQSIGLLQGMVKDVLIRGIDYGRIPGTPQDSLWDPGASQIIGSFNCYCGQRRILKLEDSDERIVVCVEVPVVSRATQQEVGSGIGAASTLETKYKYRWVANPKQWGYDAAAAKTFKTKPGRDDDGNSTTLYRIPNPEHSELLNTIVKMASKRAEVDAAESLPGVASVLRQMFSGKPFRQGESPATDEYTGPRWQRWWGKVRQLGYTDREAHARLGVASMKDWLAQGRSLDEAEAILRGNGNPEPVVDAATDEIISHEGYPDEDAFGEREAEGGIAAPAEAQTKTSGRPRRDPGTIRTINDLLRACNEDYSLQPKEVYAELNVNSANDITKSPSQCYLWIAGARR